MALRAGLFLLAVFFASSALVLSAPLSRADPAGTMAASASVLPELERDMAGFRVGLKTDDQVVERYACGRAAARRAASPASHAAAFAAAPIAHTPCPLPPAMPCALPTR